MTIDVPKWVIIMTVIKVSVAPKHLLDDALDIGVEVGREAGCLANPIIC